MRIHEKYKLPIEYTNRRVGRPRENWTAKTLENIYTINNFGTKEQFKNNVRESIDRIAPRISHKNTITYRYVE